MLKRRSIRYKITFTFIVSLLLAFALYLILLLLLWNTSLYQNYSPVFNTLYWLCILILLIIFIPPLFESITDPLRNFNTYLKNFNSVNFRDLARKLDSYELVLLAKALAELQARMKKTVSQLEQQNIEISRLNDEQKREYQHKQALISSLSHDIKTPLTVIQTTVSAIIDGIFPKEDTNKELENVLIQIEYTNRLIQDAMTIFKFDNDLSSLQFTEFNLTESIIKATNDFTNLMENHKHKLVLSLPHEVKIWGDREQFQRVLNNLLSNAVLHTPKGNEIRINIYGSKNSNILEIINTGTTIPQDELEQIFEPFYKLDKSRTEHLENGNGLGLYIVKQIIQKHRFDIGVTNLDNAVKFYIIIPKK